MLRTVPPSSSSSSWSFIIITITITITIIIIIIIVTIIIIIIIIRGARARTWLKDSGGLGAGYTQPLGSTQRLLDASASRRAISSSFTLHIARLMYSSE
jgi:hypothetical protein